MTQSQPQGRQEGPRLSLDYDPPGATLKAFRASSAMARALVGPVQGGRKTCAVYDILLRAAHGNQRRWRWAVLAANEASLDAAIAAWQAVVPAQLSDWDPKALRHQFGFAVPGPTGARRPKDLDLHFLALDRAEHRKRLATLEVSGLWLAAARELDAGVLEHALGAAGSWPLDEPPAPLVIITSRMPGEDHWLTQMTGEALTLFRQPGGRTPQAENLRHLKPGFYPRLAAGRTPEWVRVHVDAEFGSGRKAGTLEDAILKSYQTEDEAA